MKFTLKSKQLIQLFSVDMPSPGIMQFKTQPLLFQLYNQIKEAEQYVKSSLKYKYKTKHIKHSSNITKPKFFNIYCHLVVYIKSLCFKKMRQYIKCLFLFYFSPEEFTKFQYSYIRWNQCKYSLYYNLSCWLWNHCFS